MFSDFRVFRVFGFEGFEFFGVWDFCGLGYLGVEGRRVLGS